MESDAVDNLRGNVTDEGQALNSTILEYYKKFGRKRDLEQYFSLSTAQGDVRDPTSLFWRRMKSQNDSSDSGERSRESSLEVCRISIKCSVPDPEPSSSQDDNPRPKSDTESPPIIVEEVPDTSRHSDNESVKSDDNHSQKSTDAILDTSLNKAFSPTSSITSQRKLEWDSLADVGYNYESDKKTSASSLSTLERLALKQQYSNNDTKEDLGAPTAHSTPLDENDPKPKVKSKGSKTTKIYKKEVDFLQVNMPQGSSNPSQSINVNLTKHISFNVEKDGAVSIDNVKKDVSVTPEKEREGVEPETNQMKFDKEIQTSLVKTRDKSSSSTEALRNVQLFNQGIPVLINLNTLKKRQRRRKLKTVRRKLRSKKKTDADKENLPVLEKSGEPVSEAESFEYMPGHMYNPNQMNAEAGKSNNSGTKSSLTAGNKSSLESSAPTTDSSKGSAHSFTKDLEKSIKMLKAALHKRYNDSELKEKLVKEVVQRLIKSSYRDDDTTTDFLSGLSFSSKKIGLEGNTTTSTSDANNTAEKPLRPKKSILRVDKFNANALASTSQSAPNLPSVSNSEKPVSSKLEKALTSSNTESEKTSSDTAFAKTSSEELYQKYLHALRREEAYRKHLRVKETFLKQKRVASDSAFNIPTRIDPKSQLRIQELMKDLTRNNYDDGSGDASKLEGGLRREARTQRSNSVFTLSSNSEKNRRGNAKKSEAKDAAKSGHSKEIKHYCCCPLHYKLGAIDSSVQVNIKEGTSEEKHLCACNIRKSNAEKSPRSKHNVYDTGESKNLCSCSRPRDAYGILIRDSDEMSRVSKCSQTNVRAHCPSHSHGKDMICIHEAIRCTQTEISINPRISDPVLSDIEIINKCDCCMLVREQFRQVSKSSINTDTKTQDAQIDADIQSEKSSDQRNTRSNYGFLTSPSRSSPTGRRRPSTPDRVDKQRTDADPVDKQKTIADMSSDTRKPTSARKDIDGNVTIPIEGTNMTLKVNYNASDTREFEGPQAAESGFKRNEYSSLQARAPVVEKPFVRANTHPSFTGVRNTNQAPSRSKNDGQKGRETYKDNGRKYESNRGQFEEPSDRRRNEQPYSIVKPAYGTENVQGAPIRIDDRVEGYERQIKDTNLQGVPDNESKRAFGVKGGSRKPSTSQYYNKDGRSEHRVPSQYEDPITGQFIGPEPSQKSRSGPKQGEASDQYEEKDNQRYRESHRDNAEYPRKSAIRFESDHEPPTPKHRNPTYNASDIDNGNNFKQQGVVYQTGMEQQRTPFQKHRNLDDIGSEDYNETETRNYRPYENRTGLSSGYRGPTRSPDHSEDDDEEFITSPSRALHGEQRRLRSPDHTDYVDQRRHRSPDHKEYAYDDQGRPVLPNYTDSGDQRRSDSPSKNVNVSNQRGRRSPDHTDYGDQRRQRSPGDNVNVKSDQGRPLSLDDTDHDDRGRPELPDYTDYDDQRLLESHGDNVNVKSDNKRVGSPDHTDYGDQRRQRSPGDNVNVKSSDRGGSELPAYTDYGDQRRQAYFGDNVNVNNQRGRRSPDHTDYGDQRRQRSPGHNVNVKTSDRGRTELTDYTDYGDQRRQASPENNVNVKNQRGRRSPDRTDYGDQRRQRSPGHNVNIKTSDRGGSELPDYTDYGDQRRQRSAGQNINIKVDHRKGPRSPDRTDYGDQRRQNSPGDNVNLKVDASKKKHINSPSCSIYAYDTRPISPSHSGYDKQPRPSRPRTLNRFRDQEMPGSPGMHSPTDAFRARSPSPSEITANRRPSSPFHQSCIIDETLEPGVYQCRPKIQKCSCPPSYKCGGKCGRASPVPSENCCQKSGTTCKEPRCSRFQKADAPKDMILSVIKGITNKYSKKTVKDSDKKKAYKEIMILLKYLLDTEDTDTEGSRISKPLLARQVSDLLESDNDSGGEETEKIATSEYTQTQTVVYGPGCAPNADDNILLSSLTPSESQKQVHTNKKMRSVASGTDTAYKSKHFEDKSVQLSDSLNRSNRVKHTDSSDFAQTTDMPCTSSDSATCKVLDKIRRECEKYHQKRCKIHQNAKNCECHQSSTSLSCDQCKRVHHCTCRSHRCKAHKSKGSCEKVKKKCIAYNLIIQTSDSMISEEPKCENRPMKSIIVKVPKNKMQYHQYREVIQTQIPDPLRFEPRPQRSRSLPNESYPSSTDEGFRAKALTVRDYLEKNRPDFCEQYAKRQDCLRVISECRAHEREAQRELLRMQVQVDAPVRQLSQLSAADLRALATQLGLNTDRDKEPPKLISEREMKKHSERIFKTLPEQIQKKEEQKKENIRKANLLMASLFKKHLQRKTLRGTVSLSNYSKVIKI